MNPNWTRLTLLSLRAGHVPLIWGGPGIGKTEMIHDEVHTPYWGSRSAPFLTIIPAQRDPTDASGMQFVVDGEVRSLLPDYGRTLIKEGVGTLFIDELTGGTPATLGSMQRLVQERRLGDVLIPDPIRIIMAANPADIATGGADLSAPFANRPVHIVAGPAPVKKWGAWLVGKLSATPAQRKFGALYAAYVEAHGDYTEKDGVSTHTSRLYDFPAEESKRSQPWPSPRSNFMAARCLAAAMEDADGLADGLALVGGSVGPEIARELATFIREMDLPDARAVLEGTVAWTPDVDRPDTARPVLRMITNEAIFGKESSTLSRPILVEKAWEFLQLASDVGLTDIASSVGQPLLKWRLEKSGKPLEAGACERVLAPRFNKVLKALK